MLDEAFDLTFFSGFQWPVPLAFANAVAANRFEQGDVLYCDRAAYGALADAGVRAADGDAAWSAIQVLDPPRSARALPSASEADRRQSSWQSEVTLELVELASGKSEVRRLSQGKLFIALWQGDEAWLDPARAEPEMPRTARELHGQLDQVRERFEAGRPLRSGSRFFIVVDLASDASRHKARGVEEALRASGSLERVVLSPVAAGVEAAERFHPALEIRCLLMPDRSLDDVRPVLRSCLYGGRVAASSSEAQADEETPADRFSVGRHGLLESAGD